MDYFNSASFLNSDIRRETQTDHRFSHPEFPAVRDSVSNIHHQATANGTIKKTVFIPLETDQMPYAATYTTNV